MEIPSINAKVLFDPAHQQYQDTLEQARHAAMNVGFMTVFNTAIDQHRVNNLLATFRQFFQLPESLKSKIDMAKTQSNRGWGNSRSEQVSSEANPDYKQVFDCGPELSASDPLTSFTYYAPNLWPAEPAYFRQTIVDYYEASTAVALQLLSAVAVSIGKPADYFAQAFDKPMALLRGNYYPCRPADATVADFGIAPHTDYGCLTLLVTDGQPGLEVQTRDGNWQSVCVPSDHLIINFGEMLEFWTEGQVVATPHRVIGSGYERFSVPLFFNPRYDVNVAPPGGGTVILAGDHLSRRYDETYMHRRKMIR